MLYAILCYDRESEVDAWTPQKDDAVIARKRVVEDQLAAKGQLGPVVRLRSTTSAATVRLGREPLVIDGPFAETKEQLLGFFVIDVATLEEAIDAARQLAHESGTLEVRPIRSFRPGAGVG